MRRHTCLEPEGQRSALSLHCLLNVYLKFTPEKKKNQIQFNGFTTEKHLALQFRETHQSSASIIRPKQA